jgi:hypothetical protein
MNSFNGRIESTKMSTKPSFFGRQQKQQQPFCLQDFQSKLKITKIKEPTVLTLNIYTDENFCLKITTFPSNFMTFKEEKTLNYDSLDDMMMFDSTVCFIDPLKSKEESSCGYVLQSPKFVKRIRFSRYFTHSLCG